jgi:hypothetical protein
MKLDNVIIAQQTSNTWTATGDCTLCEVGLSGGDPSIKTFLRKYYLLLGLSPHE